MQPICDRWQLGWSTYQVFQFTDTDWDVLQTCSAENLMLVCMTYADAHHLPVENQPRLPQRELCLC
jgi:hypothetical protein